MMILKIMMSGWIKYLGIKKGLKIESWLEIHTGRYLEIEFSHLKILLLKNKCVIWDLLLIWMLVLFHYKNKMFSSITNFHLCSKGKRKERNNYIKLPEFSMLLLLLLNQIGYLENIKWPKISNQKYVNHLSIYNNLSLKKLIV